MSNLFTGKLNNDVKFLETHIGGNVDDSSKTFERQLEILKDSDKEFNKKFNNEEIRINPGNVSNGEFCCENPVIYPEIPDLYFQYILQKNLKTINSQVITLIDYLNIDSEFRRKDDVYSIQNFYKLPLNPLAFENNSSIMKIYVPSEIIGNFEIDNYITVDGLKYYVLYQENVNFKFEDGSPIVTLNIKANFTTIIPFVDIYVKFSEIDVGYETNYFKNVYTTYLNQIYKIGINFQNFITFELPIVYYSYNDTDNILVSNCRLEFYSLGNFPINKINANFPYTPYNIIPYQRIKDINYNNNYLVVELSDKISLNQNILLEGEWKNNLFFTGGTNIQIGKIGSIDRGSPFASDINVVLNKVYKNVITVEMISSEIPNTFFNVYNLTITNANNAFYWQNLFDGVSEPYKVTIETGIYTYKNFILELENSISKVHLINFNINGQIPYNFIKFDLDLETYVTTVKSFKKFVLPQCFINKEGSGGTYEITISQLDHELKEGQTIRIENSLDYFDIPEKYINTVHTVYKVLDRQTYKILLENVNTIPVTNFTLSNFKISNVLPETTNSNPSWPTTLQPLSLDIINYNADGSAVTGVSTGYIGDGSGNGNIQTIVVPNGGNDVTIYTDNSFRILFDKPDTCGEILGFKNVGSSIAITNYTTFSNNFQITNLDPYFYENQSINKNLQNLQNISDLKYILLKCEGLNKCNFPGGFDFFYKFTVEPANADDDTLYNTYVPIKHYFYPPLNKITQLSLQLVYPNGQLINLYNLNYSFTLKITSVYNYPENTNLNPNVARI